MRFSYMYCRLAPAAPAGRAREAVSRVSGGVVLVGLVVVRFSYIYMYRRLAFFKVP